MNRLAAALVAAALAGGGFGVSAAANEPPPAVAIPYPALDNFEPVIQRQLAEARGRLEEAIGSAATGEELGRAYGEMGRLYFLYDLAAPAEACLVNAAGFSQDFEWQHLLGSLYRTEGRFEEARSALEQALLRRADYPATFVRLGQVEVEAGRLEVAESRFRSALALDPTSAAAQFGLGRVAYAREDFSEAVRRFEAALELQPEADAVHHLLGMAHRRLGDLELARSHLAENRNRAVRVPDPLIDGLTDLISGAQYHYKAGLEALRRGDLEQAGEELRQAVEKDPSNHLAHYNLGLALLGSGSREQGLAQLRKALEVNPDYRNAHFNLGIAEAEAGRFDAAAYHFGEAHRIDPEDGLAQLEWATALLKTGQPERAVAALEDLLARDSANVEALLNLATLDIAAGRIDRGADGFGRALELDLDAAQAARARLGLGHVAERRGDEEGAIAAYRAAAELDGAMSEAHRALASALGRAGRLADAAASFGRVIELDPGDLGAYFGRATALILGGDYVAAREALEAGLERFPQSVPLAHALARLLATCPDGAVRDGAAAARLALAVFESEQSLDHAETVAMSLAEQGRFDEAVEWQRRAVSEAERSAPGAAAAASRRLALYESRRPVRAPWQQ